MKKLLFILALLLPMTTFAAGLTVPQGGTGTTTIPFNWVVLGSNSLRVTAVATSSLGLPYGTGTSGHCVDWTSGNNLGDAGAACGSGSGGSTFATTSISATYPILWNTSTAVISTPLATTTIQQTYGTAQLGQITFATTTDAFNGLNFNENISNSGGTFTFANGVTGTLNNAGLTNSTVGATSPNSTMTFGSAASLGSTFTGDLNLAHSNWWTALQNFTNATSSGLEATSTNVFFDGYASALLSVNSSHQLTAYAGTNPCSANQAIISLSALGVGSCSSTFLTSAVTAVNGTTNQITSSGGTTPTLSLPNLVLFPVAASSTLFSNFGTAYFGGSATSTFGSNGALTLVNAANALTIPFLGTAAGTFLAVDPSGHVIGTTTPSGGGGGVTNVSTDSTLTGGPCTTTCTLGFNLTNANSWTGKQTFSNSSSTLGTITTGWATNFNATFASSTAITSTNIYSTLASTTNLTVNTQSALLLTNSAGAVSGYAGAAACTNQFVTALSALGATTCASINNAQWSGTALAAGNGGTGTGSPTANDILYVNNAGNAYLFAATSTLNIGGTAAGLSATLALASGGTNATACATTGAVWYYDGTRFVCAPNMTYSGATTQTLSVTQASTTDISAFSTGFFGSTSTSTINGNGATSTLNSALTISTSSQEALLIQDRFNTAQVIDQTASTTGNVFQVSATSTGLAMYGIDQFGHLMASSTGATPAISSCGTGSPVMNLNANDTVGSFTTGTSASSCTVTFAHAFSQTPVIVISDSNTSAVVDISSISTTAFTVSLASALSADTVYYMVVMP